MVMRPDLARNFGLMANLPNRERVEVVCTDKYEPYRTMIRQVLPREKRPSPSCSPAETKTCHPPASNVTHRRLVRRTRDMARGRQRKSAWAAWLELLRSRWSGLREPSPDAA